jgi:hypothetical protein
MRSRPVASPPPTLPSRTLVMAPWSLSLHFREPRKVRALVWMERPRSLERVVVQIDEHVIFLPGLKPVQPTGIYERLATRRYWPFRRQTARHMRWHDVAWPTSPRHAFDRDPLL